MAVQRTSGSRGSGRLCGLRLGSISCGRSSLGGLCFLGLCRRSLLRLLLEDGLELGLEVVESSHGYSYGVSVACNIGDDDAKM